MLFILDTIPESARSLSGEGLESSLHFLLGFEPAGGSQGSHSGCSQMVLGRSHVHERVRECFSQQRSRASACPWGGPVPACRRAPGQGMGLDPRTGRVVGGEGWRTDPLWQAPRGRLWREPGASVTRAILSVGRDQAWPSAAPGVTSFSPPPPPWLILSEIPSLSQGFYSFQLT